jgi:hypothetical protein
MSTFKNICSEGLAVIEGRPQHAINILLLRFNGRVFHIFTKLQKAKAIFKKKQLPL